jgi:uncharacterized protein
MAGIDFERKWQMRRNIVAALSLLCILGVSPLARGEEPVRSISVSGTVETKTAPDRIVWRVNLTDTNVTLADAKKANDQSITAVLALREKLGIAEGDLVTGQMNVHREYERDQHGQRGAFKHFVVTRGATIIQRDLKRFDEFLDALVSSAEMEVNFSFESSRIHEVRAETRLKALAAARDKAEAMAQVVGAKLGRAITINEHSQDNRGQNPFSNASFVQSTPPVDLATERFAPGAISVQITVYATFELD